MRTKLTSCNEGGVHAGNGVLDSPFLIDYPKVWFIGLDYNIGFGKFKEKHFNMVF